MADQTAIPDTEQTGQQPQQGGFFSRLGAGLKKVMPYVTPIANRLAAAAGNYGPMELEHQQKELALQQAHEQTQEALAQSQMQNAELNRQLLTKQISNVRSPEEMEAMKPPADIVAPTPDGGMGHFNRSFNPVTKQYETKPTMLPTDVPNPAAQARAALTQAGTSLQGQATKQTSQVPGSENVVGPQEGIPTMPSGVAGAPPLPLPPVPDTITQQRQLPALQKPVSAGGDIEGPGMPTPSGFARVWRGPDFRMLHMEPAPAPYAYVPQQSSSVVTQTSPTGVNEVNTTQTTKGPAGGGAPPPPTRPPVPKPNAFKIAGPEAKQIMDQDVALGQTRDLINRVRANKQLFASMIDGGKIQLSADPNSGFFGKILSRNLSPQEAQLAGDVQSLTEHINTMRLALQAQGFRGEEAWNALQAQRGNLFQNPGQIDTTLGNTLAVIEKLLSNHRTILGNAAPQTEFSTAPTGSFKQFMQSRQAQPQL